MEFFKPGRYFDFMGQRHLWVGVSTALNIVALVLVAVMGFNFGTDFKGGTEVEVAFKRPIDAGEVRSTVEKLGFGKPDVVRVQTADPNAVRFMIRVQEVTAIDDNQKNAIMAALCYAPHGEPLPADRCPEGSHPTEVKFSPGGDKISLRYDREPDLAFVAKQVPTVPGVELRHTANNPQVVSARDHKVEVQLKSKGDQLMDGLRQTLGPDTVPETALRVEWVGPKAGKLLRDAAFKSVGIAIFFIMAYIAFRFDMRFAPGAIVAMIHDVMIIVGVFVATKREFSLTTVAALLTIVGYSVNDTVVVYDRIRENLGKFRGKTFGDIINMSVSEVLSRTILSSGTTILTTSAFLIFATGPIKDFAFAMFLGIIVGTYSSIYIAAPVTEFIDRRFFGGPKGKAAVKASPVRKSAEAVL